MKRMIYGLILISCCAIFLLLRLLFYKKQVQSIVNQLEHYQTKETDMKIAVSVTNKLLERLAYNINGVIDKKRETTASKIRMERSLKEAIAGMSHDLRTPLTAIIGYLQLVENEDLSEEQRKEYLHIAHKRAIRLQKLINNFFALSVAEADDYPLNLETVKLNSIVQETLLSYYDEFQAANIEPHIELVDKDIFVMADEVACKRVIENILLNAIQHSTLGHQTEESPLTIQLGVEQQQAQLTVQNNVKDQIDIADNKLFERFYTGDHTRAGHGGLGLTIVQSLMTKMQGQVIAEVKDRKFIITCLWKKAR